MKKEDLRNIAIIAHVDHGKTTLVDEMLKQSGTFRANESVQERVMDSNSLERERGITILSKNTSIMIEDMKINIIDTPGHADFGGEVERIMKMVDGVLLLIDAYEGPMPQTRFVLKKAFESGVKPIVVINKIDRPEARIEHVQDEVLDLFIDLGADEEQLDFPVIYSSAKNGVAKIDMADEAKDFMPLFKMIIENIEHPKGNEEESLQLLISSIDYDKYTGRIGIGKITKGRIEKNQSAIVVDKDMNETKVRVTSLYNYEGLHKTEIDSAGVGEIVAVSGMENINIGNTICNLDHPDPLPILEVDEPTMSMNIIVNNSPFAGRDGRFVTSRNLKRRLEREMLSNVAMRLEEVSEDTFKVYGRGELHVSILIETMRREGFEFAVSRPEVLMKETDEGLKEPIEYVYVEVPDEYASSVIDKLNRRKGEMVNMVPSMGSMTKLEFRVPARGIFGYRSELLTDTKGYGVMHHVFDGYSKYTGDVPTRTKGSLIAYEQGQASAYGLSSAQERGVLFIAPGVDVYEGMVIGENSRIDDMVLNVCKRKQMTNVRASGSDDAYKLAPPRNLSLEQSLEFIKDDELVEVTPKEIRLRKKVLNRNLRDKSSKNKK